MLTWKFEIFEDFECTKPIPITNDDRHTEFRHLVLNGNPPLSERIEDAITNYLEAVGQASKINSPVHQAVGTEPKGVRSTGPIVEAAGSDNLGTLPVCGQQCDRSGEPDHSGSEPVVRHEYLIKRLELHIDSVKGGRVEGFKSKAEFYRHLKIDRADYYRWQRNEKPRATGYSDRIQGAILKLTVQT
jgi:hypothetical protein